MYDRQSSFQAGGIGQPPLPLPIHPRLYPPRVLRSIEPRRAAPTRLIVLRIDKSVPAHY